MPPNMKHIILANINVKVYSWPLTFHKVMRQQIWQELVVLILPSSLHRSFLNSTVQELWTPVHCCQSYHKNKSGPFLETWVRYLILQTFMVASKANVTWTEQRLHLFHNLF